MDHVLVTIKRVNEARVRDIMLPADMPIGQLAAILAAKLEWDIDPASEPVTYLVEADPPGRYLRQDETLAEAGAWDGSWLVFHPKGTAASNLKVLDPHTHDPTIPSPVRGWSKLFGSHSRQPADVSPGPAADPRHPASSQRKQAEPTSGYTMKRLDRDTGIPLDTAPEPSPEGPAQPPRSNHGMKRIDKD
jgi:hypothetical protein